MTSKDAEDRSVAVQIQQALLASVRLELIPKSTIDIFITIIENDGIEGCISAGSVAASAALADAGIEMLGLVVSCSAVSVRRLLRGYPDRLCCIGHRGTGDLVRPYRRRSTTGFRDSHILLHTCFRSNIARMVSR